MVRRALVALSLPALVLLTPLPASADPAAALTIGPEALLLDPTLVRVPVEITCGPMEVYDTYGWAELKQAVSKQEVAWGDGWIDSQPVCDGTPHPNSYLITSGGILNGQPSGPPFEKGDATIIAVLELCDPTWSCQRLGSGPQVIRLTKA
jgi:hypothetical protein